MVVTFGVRLPRSISNVRTASAHAAMTARIADARNAVFSGARKNGHTGGSFHAINALPLNGWHVNQWRFASQARWGLANSVFFSLVQKTDARIYASGIRNPVRLTLQPGTDVVWAATNERDNLGDDLVPDYATSVKEGGFYGWPYSYIGRHYDPKYVGAFPDLVGRAIVPDVLVPAHSAALGITFYTGSQFPSRYRNGGFVAGSWRSTDRGTGRSHRDIGWCSSRW
jgi:Glucose / Sorbosone dehydrogenase